MHTKNIILAVLGIAFIAAVVLLSHNDRLENPSTIGAVDPMSTLTSTPWVWERTYFEDSGVMEPNQPGAFTINFTSDGTVSGTTDCNSWSSTFTLGANGMIRLGPVISTLMFCENTQETPYLSGIEGVDRVTFGEDGTMTLSVEIDGVGAVSMMQFKKGIR